MSMPGIGELILIAAIVLFVFGAGKIPKIARDLGSSFREFKKGIAGKDDDDDKKDKKSIKKKG
jgi:sec-independent protein translocase protein TatA